MKPRYLVIVFLVFVFGFAVGQVVPSDLLRTPRSESGPAVTTSEGRVVPVSTSTERIAPAPASNRLPAGLTAEESRDIEVFRRAADSVVSVRSIAIQRSFLSLDVMQIPRGSGSGFVWDEDGHIVTNYHVIEGGDAFLVTLADQSEWEADVVGVAPGKDLAVLRIGAPRQQLVPLEVGRSANLVVGQRVLAVGNPFGLDHSLTVGVLSALGRELESHGGRIIRDVLQTDAAINPGNSGGPLLDTRGTLIGVNTAIISPTGGSAGVGFAIPADTVSRLIPQVIEHGRPIQPGIGITPVPEHLIPRGVEGVPVAKVSRGGPAERAGLEGIRIGRSRRRYVFGDIIVAVDGQPVRSFNDLLDIFELKGVGTRVRLTLQRDGEEREAEVELVALR